MIDITVYEIATGQIKRVLTIMEGQAEMLANVGDGESAILGKFPPREFYVKVGEALAIPPKPAPYLTFDLESEVWVDQRPSAEVAEAMRRAVNTERDRRLAADFAFQGVMYQRDQVSLARITGAATLAGFAMAVGAPAGFLRWHGGDSDFAWIASDNSVTLMDAPTCFAFGQAAAAVETGIVFAAKALREMDPIPANFADAGYWP